MKKYINLLMDIDSTIEIEIVVAFCKKMGIGYKGDLPWNYIQEDMKRFKELTLNTVVVMGRQTYFSIPEQNRPLKNRVANIIITRTPNEYAIYANENTIFETLTNSIKIINELCKNGTKCMVIGGESIYNIFVLYAKKIHVSYIDKDFLADTYFCGNIFGTSYSLDDHVKTIYDDANKCNVQFITYKKNIHCDINDPDTIYCNLLRDILKNGIKRDDRTRTGTISVFGRQVRFDISKYVPLLTTKFISWRLVIKELLWFLRGDTNANKLSADGVKIWNANTSREFLDAHGLTEYQTGDMGPMYGFQLRHFGTLYKGCDYDYTNEGIDQINNVINLIKTDPFSRRIIMSTLNIADVDKGCLYPCHGIAIQFYVIKSEDGKNKLDCHMYQRSVDTFLGFAWNIFSYAVLTYIIAKKTNTIPNELIISTGDTHLYIDHIDAANEQLKRKKYPQPILLINDSIIEKRIEEITLDDFDVIGYYYHPVIKAKMSV